MVAPPLVPRHVDPCAAPKISGKGHTMVPDKEHQWAAADGIMPLASITMDDRGWRRASPECDLTPLSTPGSRRDLGHELHRPSRIHATVNRATAHALQASQPRSSLLATVAVAVKTMPIAELTGLAVRRSEHIWRTCSLMCASQRCKGGTLSTRGP